MNMTKVLLIEDGADIVENLTAYLREEGFQVKASDGQAKALQMLEENRFDLILLDVTLAEGNGYSVCTAIKAKYEVPVIFLSALEYRLLLVFFNNRGRILTRNQLLEDIWDIAGEYVNDNTLTVYIKRLRDKIEDDPQKPELIKTVRGMGYKMEA